MYGIQVSFFILLEAFVVVTGFSHSAYFTTRENKRLIGHRIKQVDSISLKSCSQFCLIHSWCISTNFQISTKMNGKETCEFNMHGVIDEQWSFPWSRRSNFLSDVKGKYCFVDEIGITASTYKLIDHTWTEPFRAKVFHTKTTHPSRRVIIREYNSQWQGLLHFQTSARFWTLLCFVFNR